MVTPLQIDAEQSEVFAAAFRDELTKSASGITIPTSVMKEHAPAIVAGGLGVHYGKRALDDYKRGRSQRQLDQASRAMGGGF